MAINRTVHGRIAAARRGPSKNGNPSWIIEIDLANNGDIITHRTLPSGQVGYVVTNFAGKPTDVAVTIDERGFVTNIEDVRELRTEQAPEQWLGEDVLPVRSVREVLDRPYRGRPVEVGEVPTSWALRMIDGRVRRVYSLVYGNSDSRPYVKVGGVRRFLSDEIIAVIRRLANEELV